jgi:23S rRNA (uridine2552-2'-O)-methyltransferase
MPKPYTPNDKFMYKAQREGFRARSVYKLQELNERYELFTEGQKVLDIGAAPGSWLQYASEQVGLTGLVMGIDIHDISPVAENVKTYICDISDSNCIETVLQENNTKTVDILISDMAPNTTGIPGVDSARSLELSTAVVALAKQHLKQGGNLIMKVFQGAEFPDFYHSLNQYFKKVTSYKPKASRDRSKEIYIVCLKKR